MAHDVFISYSHKDAFVAQAVCAKLEEKQIRCWYAPRNIDAGDEWASAIMKGLRAAKAMILIFTDYSNASVQVRREVDNAISEGIPVIPFKLTENDPSGGMEYYLSTLHWLDAVDKPLEKSIDELTVMVRNILAGKDLDNKDDWKKTKKGVKLTGRALFKLIASIILLLAGIFLLIIFFDNPSIHSTAQLVILGIGAILAIVAAYLIFTIFASHRSSKSWLYCLGVCLLVGLATIGRSIIIEMNAPEISISVKDDAAGMNMANYSIAAIKDDQVYYADIVEGVPGIYSASLDDFYENRQGTRLVQNVEADNLTLTSDALVYRDISNDRRHLCVYDLQSGTNRTLKKNDTSHYYGSRNTVLFSLDSFGAGTSILMEDGSYETSISDLACSDLYIYKGEIYAIDPESGLCKVGFANNRNILSALIRNTFIIHEEVIYFKGSNGKGIYTASLKEPETANKLSDNECNGMVVYEDSLYYINSDDNYTLYKISLSEGSEEQIDKRAFSCINIIGESLYLFRPDVGYVRILLT
ncbi:MAG: TIR domain-containing protein [Erysipelotrichaceae bacterium]|nr:TIR domain-containing protein [Erysipelotrichaceae bacterium]